MPSYDYYCPANGRIVEVRHRMSESLTGWGELCERAEIDPGTTPADSPVQLRISGGQFIRRVDTETAGAKTMTDACCGNMGCGCRGN